jgi:hypothetical protein
MRNFAEYLKVLWLEIIKKIVFCIKLSKLSRKEKLVENDDTLYLIEKYIFHSSFVRCSDRFYWFLIIFVKILHKKNCSTSVMIIFNIQIVRVPALNIKLKAHQPRLIESSRFESSCHTNNAILCHKKKRTNSVIIILIISHLHIFNARSFFFHHYI